MPRLRCALTSAGDSVVKSCFRDPEGEKASCRAQVFLIEPELSPLFCWLSLFVVGTGRYEVSQGAGCMGLALGRCCRECGGWASFV